MNSKTFLRASASCAALVLGLPFMGTPATAQETSGPQAGAIETVTVTARKREESEKDVPIAITAISADTIREMHITQAKDIAAYVPGLNINSDSVGRTLIDIRGVGTTLLDNVQPGVGIFIDGVYMPVTSYLNTPLIDVARVEVLKGPQGTLFGNNTLGGAINIITKQPTDEFQGMLTGSYAGSDNYQQAAGDISGPIIEGTLQARLGLGYTSDNGFIKNVIAGGYQNPLVQQTANSTLRWEASPEATITVNSYYNRVQGGLVNYYPVSGPKDYSDKAATSILNRGTYVYSGVNAKGVFAVPAIDTTITAVAAYDHRLNSFSGDDDFGPIDLVRGRGTGMLYTNTGELRFDTKWDDNISTLFGVFYDTQTSKASDVTSLNLSPIVPPSVFIDFPGSSRANTTNFAAYGTVFWNIDPTVEFTAGLRWDHQKAVATGGAVPAIKSNELEPRFTLTKHWTESIMTYASAARGYRGGGINPPGSPNPAYRGDSVWTYELGAKTTLLNNTLSLDVAAFYNDYYHFIGQNSLAPKVPGPGFVGINLNSGHVTSPGAEAQFVWRATNALTINGGITYTHARIIDGSEYVATTGMGLPSDRILLLPDWNWNLAGDYLLPIGDDALDFNAGLVFKGERHGSSLTAGFAPSMEAYTLVNGAITWRHEDWDVSVYGTNLFNQKYFESYIDQSVLMAAGIPAFDVGILGEKRRVGVSATYRF